MCVGLLITHSSIRKATLTPNMTRWASARHDGAAASLAGDGTQPNAGGDHHDALGAGGGEQSADPAAAVAAVSVMGMVTISPMLTHSLCIALHKLAEEDDPQSLLEMFELMVVASGGVGYVVGGGPDCSPHSAGIRLESGVCLRGASRAGAIR